MAQNRHVLLPLVFASITALAFDAATIRPTFDPASIQGRVRAAGGGVEGVHAGAPSPLAERVLAAVPELARWDAWYAHPPSLSNGHAHTILAAKLRKTRPVLGTGDMRVGAPDGLLGVGRSDGHCAAGGGRSAGGRRGGRRSGDW